MLWFSSRTADPKGQIELSNSIWRLQKRWTCSPKRRPRSDWKWFMNNARKVIVALDLETASAALDLAARISPVFPFFKIGIRLFTQAGPSLIRDLLQHGNVFL